MRDRYSTSVQRHRLTPTTLALARCFKLVYGSASDLRTQSEPITFRPRILPLHGSRPPCADPMRIRCMPSSNRLGKSKAFERLNHRADSPIERVDRRCVVTLSECRRCSTFVERSVEAPTLPSPRPHTARRSSSIFCHLVCSPLQQPLANAVHFTNELGRDVFPGQIPMEREKR